MPRPRRLKETKKRALGTRLRIPRSKILRVPVFMCAVVMFLYTLWDYLSRQSMQDFSCQGRARLSGSEKGFVDENDGKQPYSQKPSIHFPCLQTREKFLPFRQGRETLLQALLRLVLLCSRNVECYMLFIYITPVTMETSGHMTQSVTDIFLGKLNFSDYNLNVVAQVK